MRHAVGNTIDLPLKAARAHETTARSLFLLAAVASFVLSVSLWFSGHELQGIFVGLWVPSILSLANLALGSERGR
ncbi:MAG: hypothetical protein ACM3QU_15570 [Verrucomicrobiota bacterium]